IQNHYSFVRFAIAILFYTGTLSGDYEFIECYKKTAIKLGGSQLKFAEVCILPDKIIFALAY
ncbi:hypothetical protein AAH119_23670, partial [Bacteroides thetaiotaomicron]